MKKLGQRGFTHLLALVVVAVAVGGVGTYVLVKSHAATMSGVVITGTQTNCGSAYGATYYDNVKIENLVYNTKLRDSNSVRNLAKYVCEKGKLDARTAMSINNNGTWSNKLQAGIKNYELSDSRLAKTADGMPDAKLVCSLGESTYFDSSANATYYGYWIAPVGFPNTDCYSLLGTVHSPTGK